MKKRLYPTERYAASNPRKKGVTRNVLKLLEICINKKNYIRNLKIYRDIISFEFEYYIGTTENFCFFGEPDPTSGARSFPRRFFPGGFFPARSFPRRAFLL